MITLAFASDDGVTINQHFGWAKTFWLYAIDQEQSQFLKSVDVGEEPQEEHLKLAHRIETIKGARIVFCTHIGPTASHMVQASKITSVKSTETIEEAIGKIQNLLLGEMPLWLARIVHTS